MCSKFNNYFESFAPFNKNEPISKQNNLGPMFPKNKNNNNNNNNTNNYHGPINTKVDGAYYTNMPTQGGYSESINQVLFQRQFSRI